MSTADPPLDSAGDSDALLAALKSQEARIARLEEDTSHKTIFNRLAAGGSAAALFLGLLLTAMSLYGIFVTQPRADRINLISRFNQAVNAVASAQEAQVKAQMEPANGALQLAVASALTPQILNDVSTARAMLRDMNQNDVGISQLIVLISAALTAGDLLNAEALAAGAVKKPEGRAGVTPYLHSEAERYAGRVWFAMNNAAKGRQSYEAALGALGTAPATTSNRAFDLEDLVTEEYVIGDCNDGGLDFLRFAKAVNDPQIARFRRSQMVEAMMEQLPQVAGPRCPVPAGLYHLVAN